jgi:ribose-phosphate pyrophosphokinase
MSYSILSGSNTELSENIADIIKQPLCSRTIKTFKNGEICVSIHESIRNKDVFIIQKHLCNYALLSLC